MQIHMVSATFPIYGETSDLVSVDYEPNEFSNAVYDCKKRMESMFPFPTEWTIDEQYGCTHYVLVDEKLRIPLGRIWIPENEWLAYHTFIKYVGKMAEQDDDCDDKFYNLDDF